MADKPIDTTDQQAVTVAQEYRKTATIRASQWWKMGDHPAVVMASDVKAAIAAGHPTPWCPTLEGGHDVTPGDWIATGVQGEHWPIKADVFAATYAPVESVMDFGEAIDPNASHNHRHIARHRLASVSSASADTPAGMKPWTGGDVRPADWNPAGDAIMVDPSDMHVSVGPVPEQMPWKQAVGWKVIVAYTPKSEPVPATNQAGEVEQSDWDFAYSFTRKGYMKGSAGITVSANLVSEYRRSFVSSGAPCQKTNGVGETGPCANCGSEAASIKGPDKLHPYRVVCKSCGASTAHHASWRASNDAWNRRPLLATQPATSQEITWRGTEDEQYEARINACCSRRTQWPAQDCPRDGSCDDCWQDMAEALRVKPESAAAPATQAATSQVPTLPEGFVHPDDFAREYQAAVNGNMPVSGHADGCGAHDDYACDCTVTQPATSQEGELAEIIACMDQMLDDPVLDALAFDKHDSRIIRSALATQPASHEAVFEVRVGGENTTVHTRAGSNTDPVGSLTAAIEALSAERTDAAQCPAHKACASPAMNDDALVAVLKGIDDGQYASLQDRVDAIRAALTTQPATSQEGELVRHWNDDRGVYEYVTRAATPTPPTLSEDLREARRKLEAIAAIFEDQTISEREAIRKIGSIAKTDLATPSGAL